MRQYSERQKIRIYEKGAFNLMDEKHLQKLFTDHVIKNKENYYRLAYSYVKNADDALDIVQESIYKAISSIESLKNPKYIKTWFYRIVVNTSLDFLRKHKRVDVVEQEILERCVSGDEDDYENIDLHRALDELSPNYRTIIVLRYFEDLKIEEVADVLNENVNTVKTRLYRALKMLRVKMEDDLEAISYVRY